MHFKLYAETFSWLLRASLATILCYYSLKFSYIYSL